MALLEEKNLTVLRRNGMLPRIPFLLIKEKILHKKYSLTISFISPDEALSLNTKYRQKKYIPNILSFPLSEETGEIFICLSESRRQAKDFEMSYQKFLHLLIIHGCLHLKGHAHGSTMEEQEDSLLTYFYRE